MKKLEIELGKPTLTLYSHRVGRVTLKRTFDTYEELDKYLRGMINKRNLLLKHREFEYLDVFFNEKYVIYLTKPVS